jgi:hypothetical protein
MMAASLPDLSEWPKLNFTAESLRAVRPVMLRGEVPLLTRF